MVLHRSLAASCALRLTVVLMVAARGGDLCPAWSAGERVAPAVEVGQEVEDRAALVHVHLPLTGSADQAIQSTLERTCDRLLALARQAGDARRPVLVLQLDPRSLADSAGKGSQFERVFSLARFLCSRQMAGVKTVAFVPQSIRGHGVLLALACEEIVMAADAQLGEAGIDEAVEGTIRQTVIAAYREIAETRRTIPVALAVGMIDASAEVLQVETEDGIHFVLRREFEPFAQKHEILEKKVLVPRGTMAQFDGREGRQFGFVKYLASDLAGVAKSLDVAVESLRENDALAGQWRPIMVDIRGPITPHLASQIETLIGNALQKDSTNWIGVRIDSAGGDLEASVRLATTFARLDSNSVRTVAYVPAEAAGGAAVAALACDQLVMHPTAHLRAGKSAGQMAADELDAAKTTLRQSLAPRAGRSWSLLAAMIDPGIELFSYHHKTSGEDRLMSAEEAAQQPDAASWQRGQPLQENNQPLTLSGQRALELGIASQTVESFDELKQLFGFREDPPTVKPNWALELIEALASPEFAVLLLMAGFAGIYLELRTPGLGVGGFVGSVALMLFFWSKYLEGTAGWLEVLLFAAGISFILLEVFVIPGFGIFGLGGGMLVVASLVLASLTFVRPRSESDLEDLARAAGVVAIAGIGVMAFVVASRRYLPQAPVFRRMVLAPLPPAERAALDNRETLADYSSLVGAEGVAATHLRPAGKAKIGHQLVDVLAEGEPLDRGTPIVVVEAHANRVIVRAVGPA